MYMKRYETVQSNVGDSLDHELTGGDGVNIHTATEMVGEGGIKNFIE